MCPLAMDRFGPAASLAVISSSGAADISLMIAQVKSASRRANDRIFMKEEALRARGIVKMKIGAERPMEKDGPAV